MGCPTAVCVVRIPYQPSGVHSRILALNNLLRMLTMVLVKVSGMSGKQSSTQKNSTGVWAGRICRRKVGDLLIIALFVTGSV